MHDIPADNTSTQATNSSSSLHYHRVKTVRETVEELQHYANDAMKQTNNLSSLFKRLKKPVIPMPKNLPEADKANFLLLTIMWEKEVDFYVKRKVTLESDSNLNFYWNIYYKQSLSITLSQI